MTRIDRAGRELLLTYCTNVHPGETVDAIERSIDRVTVPVRAAVASGRPFGLGLWFASTVVDELTRDAAAFDRFHRFLAERDLFAFTLNAFPYGGFHDARVKEKVFLPSWSDPSRGEYTIGCARLLARLLPAGTEGSISTVPLGHRAAGFAARDRAAAGIALAKVATELDRIEEESGRSIVLGLEPEPTAELGTIDAAVDYLANELYPAGGDAVRRRIGLCLDACHEAVTFQDPAATIARIGAAGVPVAKFQVTSAIEAEDPLARPDALDALRAFDEGRYLHQVGVRFDDGRVELFSDLDPFFVALGAGRLAGAATVRVHFHVPVFAAPSSGVGTTRGDLERLLALALESAATRQFEVETYTFDVIPAGERERLGASGLEHALARELEWASAALGPDQGGSERR